MRALVALILIGCGSTPSTPDAAVTPDAGTDAYVARCLEGTDPPSWAHVEDAPHRWRVECSERSVSIWSLADGTLRVRYLPSSDPVDRSFALVRPANELAGAPIEVVGLPGNVAGFCTPELEITVQQAGCLVQVRTHDGTILLDDRAGTANDVTRSALQDEPFFGLGEKTGALDRRGRRLVFRNTDAYDPAFGGYAPDQDPLYASIPFFVALRGSEAYGLFTDSAYRLTMDLGAADSGSYRITSEGPSLDQYLFVGPQLPEVVRRYSALTGRTPLPPRWALGFHQSRWGYAPDTRLLELASQFRTRNIPADSLWLDIQHMDGFRSFTFDPIAFPDPDAMIASLRAQGFRTIVIEDPGLKVDDAWSLYQQAIASDLILHDPAGGAYQGTAWPGAAVFLDYTQPEARAFWSAQVAGLVDRGIAGVWLDVNEPTVFPESGGGSEVPDGIQIAGDGNPTTMAEGHNVYALHEAAATFARLASRAPDARPFILTRAGYAGIQRYAAMWTGDAPSSWTTLRQTPAMLMSLGLSGVPFVGSDIGGYSGGASPELFARWLELGAFSPFCRAHVTHESIDQEPWAFGQEVEDISRNRLQERYRWLPYLYSLFAQAAQSGAPIMRPMVYEFQDQPELWRIDDQAMIGPWLLIAPALEQSATQRQVHLPAGRWTELDSGAMYEGEATVSLTLAAVPTFVREGAILPRTSPIFSTNETPGGPLRLDVYPAIDESSFTLYDDAGEGYGPSTRTTFTLARNPTGATLAASRNGDYPITRELEIHVHGVDGAVSGVRRDATDLALRTSDTLALGGYLVDANDRSIVVRMSDAPSFTLSFAYDPSVTELRPLVDIEVEVTVPGGTPSDAPICIATSVDGWTSQQPLTRIASNIAHGTIRVPRGEWFEYKYTRGGWTTVEVWPGCIEASNRYGFGAAHPLRQDSVAAWRDGCP